MKITKLKFAPILLFMVGLAVLAFSSRGGPLFAHDDAAPHQNHPPPHAIDVMRAFEDDHHEVLNLAAAAVNTCTGGFADIYPCSNVDLMAFLPLGDIGGGEGNDIWGWTDPLNGNEYAIMGRTNGTSFVDITDPANPVYLGNLPMHSRFSSSWRDVKVYNNHAYVVSEANRSGMQVFDLTQLRNVASPPVTFSETAYYNGFRTAHNIAINEDSGYAYAVGTNDCNGGLHMVNIQNPTNPTSAGCYSADGYTHDAQCVIYNGPDGAYQGNEICFNYNEDTLTIVDVTNKNNPVMLSRTGYVGSEYTHQGWLTEDQAHLLMDDELDERNHGHGTRTQIWDVSDLDNPVNTGAFTNSTAAIDHNLYIKGDYAYQANYRSGLRILDITDIANNNLSEVAFFDIYPDDDAAQFNGAWSNYPYFASGTVIVSGIEQGLYVLRPNISNNNGSAPTASVIQPTHGSTVSGVVTIQIDANDVEDAAGTLTVEWNLSGSSWLPATYNGTTGYYEATWDTTLNGDGGYALNVRATDSDGQSGNDSINVTVDNVPSIDIHVGDLDSSTSSGNGGKWNATVTITVHDSGENPVANATVSAAWSNGVTGSGSCVTDGSGSCSISRNNIRRNTNSVTFSVTNVSDATNSYAPGSNHDPDGDSDGTAMVITKP